MAFQNEALFNHLQRLVASHGPSGFEPPVVDEYLSTVRLTGVAANVDILGNGVARFGRSGAPKILIAAHADQIGFLITAFNSDGTLSFRPIGNHTTSVVSGQRVVLRTANGSISGAISVRPATLAGQTVESSWESMAIDIGCLSEREARALAAPGDPVVYDAPLIRLAGSRVCGGALDDRAGLAALIEIVTSLVGESIDADIYAVATVMEEIGWRGAKTSALAIDPAIALVIDTTYATDCPGGDPKRYGPVVLGGGPVISRGPNMNPALLIELVNTAENAGIKYQIDVNPAGSSSDVNPLQVNAKGVASALISIPSRYLHSPNELADLDDIQATADLLVAYLRHFNASSDYTPTIENTTFSPTHLKGSGQ